MTARIHLLSADIRRPSRAGDLIIPILDPEGEDRTDFIKYTLQAILDATDPLFDSIVTLLDKNVLAKDYSAAAFASLRSHLSANKKVGITQKEIIDLVDDLIPPAIGPTREYQRLQALLNCTRRSLPTFKGDIGELRNKWELRVKELERQGMN